MHSYYNRNQRKIGIYALSLSFIFRWAILRRCEQLDYRTSVSRMINVWCIGKNLEGSDHSLIEVLFLQLPGESDANHQRTSSEWLRFESNTYRIRVESVIVEPTCSVINHNTFFFFFFFCKLAGWNFGYCGHLLAYCASPG
jgi:hypothetical protein